MLKKHVSVLQLNKKYHANFFLSDLLGHEKCPVIADTVESRRIIRKLRKDGFLCVPSGGWWHIFYKEQS